MLPCTWKSKTKLNDVIWAHSMIESGEDLDMVCASICVSRRGLARLLRRLGLKEPPCRIVAPSYESPISDADIAYIAGLFDGDGSIHKPRKSHWLSYAISIVSIHKTTVDWLASFGGSVIQIIPRRWSKKPQYVWRILNKKGVRSFLADVFPYLIVKKDRALGVIEKLNIDYGV